MTNRLKKILPRLIALLVFLLPWQTVYIFDERSIGDVKSQLLTGQIFATEPLLWLIAMVYLVAYFRPGRLAELWTGFAGDTGKRNFVVSIWLLLAWAGLSIIWAPDRWPAFYLWFRILEAAALLFIILSAKIPRQMILWPLLIASACQGLFACWQFLAQAAPAAKLLGLAYHSASISGDIVINSANSRWLRAYGSFGHPNVLGGFLVLGLIAGVLLWLNRFQAVEKKYDSISASAYRAAILASSILTAAGLFFTFSRSAWLAAIAGAIIFIVAAIKLLPTLPQRARIGIWLLPLSLLALSGILSLIFLPLILARAETDNYLEAISYNERINQAYEAFSLIRQAPLLGTGLNNYTVMLSAAYPERSAKFLQPVHNIYLLLTAELGLIGLLLLIILILTGFSQMLSQRLIILSLLALLPLLLIGLFDHYLLTQYAGIMIVALSLTSALQSGNFQAHETWDIENYKD